MGKKQDRGERPAPASDTTHVAEAARAVWLQAKQAGGLTKAELVKRVSPTSKIAADTLLANFETYGVLFYEGDRGKLWAFEFRRE